MSDQELARVSAVELKEHTASVLSRVKYKQERIVVQRYGRDVAVLVSLEDLKKLLEGNHDGRRS